MSRLRGSTPIDSELSSARSTSLEERVRKTRAEGNRHGTGDLDAAARIYENCLHVFWEMAEMGTLTRAVEAMRRRHLLFWFPLDKARDVRPSAPIRSEPADELALVQGELEWKGSAAAVPDRVRT